MKTSSKIVIYAIMNSIRTNTTSHKYQFAAPFVIFCCFRCTVLPTIPFFAGHSTTLLTKLYVSGFLLDVKFWQMDQVFASAILAVFLLHLHVTCHACTTGLKYWLQNWVLCVRFRSEPDFFAFGHVLEHISSLFMRMHHSTTSGLKFADLRFEFSVPNLPYGEKFWKLGHDFRYL